MDTPELEICPDAAKRDERGRRIVEENERGRLLAAYAESGLTQKAFARREGINYHTFVAWLGRSRRAADADATAQVPVRFREVALENTGTGAPLEARLPGGILVRGGEPRALAQLIRLLRD